MTFGPRDHQRREEFVLKRVRVGLTGLVVLFVIAPLLFAVWRRMPCADASAAPSPARLPRMDPSHPHSRVRDLATDEVDGEADEQNAEGALHRLGRKVLRES